VNPLNLTSFFRFSDFCIDKSQDKDIKKVDNSQIAEIENSIDEKDHKTPQSKNILSDTDANVETEVEKIQNK
jgi:hypothetical protein